MGISDETYGNIIHVGNYEQKYNGSTEAVINQAIAAAASGDTIYIHAGRYLISHPIKPKSGISLKGDGDSTIIHGASSSSCNTDAEPGYIYLNGLNNVEISHIMFTSPATGTGDGGHGDYRNCIRVRNSKDCKFHHITFKKYMYSDGIRISASSEITIYNCTGVVGHDFISCLSGTVNSRIYNCDINVQTNTGIRVDNAGPIEIDHCTITGTFGSGWCCLEMEHAAKANIHHNILHDYNGSSADYGIAPYELSGSGVSIHNNVMWNCNPYIGSGMTPGSGNIFGTSDHSVSNWVAKGYGYDPDEPNTEEPNKPAFLIFECDESQLIDIMKKYPDRIISRRI